MALEKYHCVVEGYSTGEKQYIHDVEFDEPLHESFQPLR